MAFDGIALRAVAIELARTLTGGRIDRVYQPSPHAITLECYTSGAPGAAGAHGAIGRHGTADTPGGEHTLLISCHPRLGRIHLTRQPRENPRVPTAFCMLLRKHLEGGRLRAFDQDGLERILRLAVEACDDTGALVRRTLVVELTGKHANLLLLDESGRILDALKRLPAAVNRHREVLPGRPYVPPPSQDKLPLVPFDATALAARWAPSPPSPDEGDSGRAGEPAWRRLVERVAGLGPVNAREALHRAGLDPEAAATTLDPVALATLGRAMERMAAQVTEGGFTPTAVQPEPCGDTTRLPWFSALALSLLPPAARRHEPSPSRLLDDLYSRVESAERVQAEHHRLAQTVAAHLEKLRRKLLAQEEERREAAAAENHRRCGELLTAQLHLVRPGLTEVRVTDYYDPDGGQRTIPVDPRLGPTANAQAYFKRYQKGKRALAAVEEKLAHTLEEIRYLEGVESALEALRPDTAGDAASPEELADIAAELTAQGYLATPGPARARDRIASKKTPKAQKKGRRPHQGTAPRPGADLPAGRPFTFVSSDGLTILVGKNNKQNDYLTLRLAAPGDLWLHTREIPGSHVIVRLNAPGSHIGPGSPGSPDDLSAVPRRTLEEAAMLAAYHSQARYSSKVPVDVTWRRHVRKPRGARPGFVIYTGQRTLYVTPDPAVIEALRKPPASPP